MNLSNEILRTLRLADRLATLTGNRDAAAGLDADGIAKAIGDARHAIIQTCLDDQRRLRSEGFFVRLPILRDLRDDELVAARSDLTRKGKDARKAKLDAMYEAKRGVRPSRPTAPKPQHDRIVERLKENRREVDEQVAGAMKALGGLALTSVQAEAAE